MKLKICLFYLLNLLLVAQASASTENICFGCTDTDVNGVCDDGECSVNGAYTTLSSWQTNASNLTDARVVTIKCKSNNCATADSGAITISKTGTSGTNTLTFISDASSRHDGKINTSKYRFENSASSGVGITISTAYTKFIGLQFGKTDTGSGTGYPLRLNADNITLQENLIYQSGNTSTVFRYGFDSNGAALEGLNIINNIIYGVNDAATSSLIQGFNIIVDGNTTIANNTIANLEVSSGTAYCLRIVRNAGTYNLNMYNNYCQKNWDVTGTGGTYNHSNNASGDASSPDNTYDSVTPTFVDSANNDYHIQSGDTALKNSGTDLSGTFTTDIDSETRTGTWDIGADEYASATSGLLLYLNARGEN